MRELADAAIAGIAMTEQGDLSNRDAADVYWGSSSRHSTTPGTPLPMSTGLSAPRSRGRDPVRASRWRGRRPRRPTPAFPRLHQYRLLGPVRRGRGSLNWPSPHGLASVVIVPTVAAGRATGYAGADRNDTVARMAMLGSPNWYIWGTTRMADYAGAARRHMHRSGQF